MTVKSYFSGVTMLVHSAFCLSNTVTASSTIYIGRHGQRVAENKIGRTHVYAKYNIRGTR